jgi:alpha-tubulin suppressor-like RCC1 family protein
MPTFNFKDNDGVDIGDKYVTKEYVMDAYPDLVPGFTSGELFTCGYRQYGRLGVGDTTTYRSSPGTTVSGVTTWKQVSAGSRYVAAGIKTDGTLWTWGSGSLGGMGDGTSTSRSSPGTTAGGGTNWKQVAVGDNSVAAVKTDGTLWTWGQNTSGNLGTGDTTDRSSPGTTAGGGTNWKQVAAFVNVTAAIKSDGTLWTCGYNAGKALGVGDTTNRSSFVTTSGGGTTWKQVAISTYHGAAVKTDGTLWTWGSNGDGRLGTNNTTSRTSPGTTSGGGTNWKQVSCGEDGMVAIKTDGTLWTWGGGYAGNLGDGTTTARSSPETTAGGGTNWKRVEAKHYTVCAIKNDGTSWTWGYGAYGQLGDNTSTNRSSPGTVVGGITTWKDITTSLYQLMLISDQGGL